MYFLTQNLSPIPILDYFFIIVLLMYKLKFVFSFESFKVTT